MPPFAFDELKKYVGFGPDDAAVLRALAEPIAPALPRVVERFYAAIELNANTRAVLRGVEQAARLRRTLLEWLRGLFGGDYGDEYARRRARIGHVHVQVGLPPHFMVAAMEVVWQELERAVHELPGRNRAAQRRALHKLLSLELALMLGSYQESFADQVRQVERDAMQARLREAEKLAEVGQLAASLAHEIKNPLAGISGAIQVIRAGLRQTDPHWPVLGEVLRQITRLDRTVKDLLVYARPKPPRYQRCELRRAIERVLTLLRKEPEFERVRFEYRVERDLPDIAADEHQLEQLLMNLLLNAAQASAVDGLVRLVARAEDSRVELLVSDRGCGMSPEVLRRALEPFYTTKARGTGLGLPICQKIVEAHGGRLSIRSAPGEGTEVTVELLVRPPGS